MGGLTYEERPLLGERALSLTAAILRREERREIRQRAVDALLEEGLLWSPDVRQRCREEIRALDDELRSELRW